MNVLRGLVILLMAWTPVLALAAEPVSQAQRSVGSTGVSGLWMLANLCFAGMRAQNNLSAGWRIVAFIFGFPGTLITYFVVDEGAERAYGVDIPRKR